ncbi:ribonuclease H-like YkuK family protein [Cohnella boryungensis]|uniref:Ribonuclease H-like YkuK family protein n=1 Tax=Cohnella boryungensis TaxID=768479 RepID=A0ABV8SBZ9_9BACL
MQRRQIPTIYEKTFRNVSEKELTMNDVFARIRSFMQADPRAAYQLMVGTDAQVHAGHTKFVTSVVVFRPGKGAWFCYRQVILPREIRSLQEKLSLETTFSQEVASYFDGAKRAELEDILLPYVYQGADLKLFIDIDAGTDGKRNRTSAFVTELVGRIEAMGLSARVKPEAIAASAISNRYTKAPYRGQAAAAAT